MISLERMDETTGFLNKLECLFPEIKIKKKLTADQQLIFPSEVPQNTYLASGENVATKFAFLKFKK